MATKTIRIDDIDGSETDVQHVTFALDGDTYTIDLSAANRAELKHALAPFISKAEKHSARKRSRSGASAGAAVRAWAVDNGKAVPARGRIPADVQQEYQEAQRAS